MVLASADVEFMAALPDYETYLRSDAWRKVRKRALLRAEYRCQVCNSPEALEVHHRTYKRFGYERDADLTVLCGHCHSRYHQTAHLDLSETHRRLLRVLKQDGPLSASGLAFVLDEDLRNIGIRLAELRRVELVAKTGRLWRLTSTGRTRANSAAYSR